MLEKNAAHKAAFLFCGTLDFRLQMSKCQSQAFKIEENGKGQL